MTGSEVKEASSMKVTVRGRVNIPGPEDIVIDHAAGVAYVSSEQRRSASGKVVSPGRDGTIFALDLNSEPLAPRPVADEKSLGFPFHPHGMSLFSGPEGGRRLLVINHRGGGDHAIETFDVVGDRLIHAGTVRDREHLINPNDLVALDGERFYVTNFGGATNAILLALEAGAALPWSTVVFHDGRDFHTVAGRIELANGIALDHTRGRLYVAATRTKRIYDYAWSAADPARELTDPVTIELPGCPDNLEWDEDGDLWVGADPSSLKLTLYFAAPRLMPRAPSLVLRLRFDGAARPRVETVFHDDTGDLISASSVAVVHGRGAVRRLLIGAPVDDHLLDCELTETKSPAAP